MATPLINGEAYSWSQIEVNVLGRDVAGITSVSYSETEEMEDNFGAGNRPVSRGYGAITTEASLTLQMEEVEALQEASPDGRLQSIPEFDVNISYLPKGGGTIRTHRLRNCRFMSNAREVSQGDMMIEVELELKCSHIEWRA